MFDEWETEEHKLSNRSLAANGSVAIEPLDEAAVLSTQRLAERESLDVMSGARKEIERLEFLREKEKAQAEMGTGKVFQQELNKDFARAGNRDEIIGKHARWLIPKEYNVTDSVDQLFERLRRLQKYTTAAYMMEEWSVLPEVKRRVEDMKLKLQLDERLARWDKRRKQLGRTKQGYGLEDGVDSDYSIDFLYKGEERFVWKESREEDSDNMSGDYHRLGLSSRYASNQDPAWWPMPGVVVEVCWPVIDTENPGAQLESWLSATCKGNTKSPAQEFVLHTLEYHPTEGDPFATNYSVILMNETHLMDLQSSKELRWRIRAGEVNRKVNPQDARALKLGLYPELPPLMATGRDFFIKNGTIVARKRAKPDVFRPLAPKRDSKEFNELLDRMEKEKEEKIKNREKKRRRAERRDLGLPVTSTSEDEIERNLFNNANLDDEALDFDPNNLPKDLEKLFDFLDHNDTNVTSGSRVVTGIESKAKSPNLVFYLEAISGDIRASGGGAGGGEGGFLGGVMGRGWVEWFDGATNSTYYYNTVTGATQWEYPEEGLAPLPSLSSSPQIAEAEGIEEKDEMEEGKERVGETILDGQGQLHAKGREKALITALSKGFRKVELEWMSNQRFGREGSCAIVGLLHGPSIESLQVYIANLGDSRGVLCRGGSAVPLSEDHKPDRPDEVERIKGVGGAVVKVAQTWRVFDPSLRREDRPTMLAVSRAFGDRDLKKPKRIVSAVPEVTVVPVSPADLFIVFACDGIWDVLNNQQVVDLVNGHWGEPEQAALAVKEKALTLGSGDDLTVMVIMFAWQDRIARRVLSNWRARHVQDFVELDQGKRHRGPENYLEFSDVDATDSATEV
ncbi:hypothetical protein AAMO2058_000486500 [Amorphochlora amoebiformis]